MTFGCHALNSDYLTAVINNPYFLSATSWHRRHFDLVTMATTAVPSGGRSEGELKLMNKVDPACKNFRKVLQQNSKESSECVRQHKCLERQKQSIHAQLSREEKELKDQLKRLQDEKRMFDLCDDFERVDATSVLSLDASGISGCEEEEEEEEALVVNPYPVTFPGRKISAPSRTGWSQHDPTEEGIRSASRAVSFHNVAELDGLDYPPATPATMSCLTSLLPPLHSSSRLRSRSHTSPSGSPSWESSGGLFEDSGDPWVGDPEAIASVRRQRKSVAQQRRKEQQHVWSRSSSLKEARSSGSRGHVSCVIARSSSMRERYPSGCPSHDSSPRSLLRSSSGMLSSSLKKSSLLRSIESLADSLHSIDVSPTHRGPTRIRTLKPSDPDSCSSTPESPTVVSEAIYKLRQQQQRGPPDVLTINVEAPPSADSLPPIVPWDGRELCGTPPSPLSLKPPSGLKQRSPRGSLKKRRARATKTEDDVLEEDVIPLEANFAEAAANRPRLEATEDAPLACEGQSAGMLLKHEPANQGS